MKKHPISQMKNKFLELQFRKELEIIGFEILTFKELYQKNDSSFLASPKRLNFYEILFIEEGDGNHFIDFSTYHFKKGNILFIGKNQVHAWQKELRSKGYVLLFTENFLFKNQIQFSDLAYDYPYNSIIHNPLVEIVDDTIFDTFLTLIQLIYKEYLLIKNEGRQDLLQTLLRIFFVKVQSQLPNEEIFVDKDLKGQFIQLQKAIDQNIEQTRNASDYVNMLGQSYHQLNTIVKRFTNKSLKVFIDDKLILNAKRLLCDKDNNVNEIAFMLGFDEPTNFTKYFKKHSHQTPKQFRETILK